MRRLALVVATAGGAGYAPVAPGTAGSAVGLAVFWLLQPLPRGWHLLALLAIIAAGLWAAQAAATHFGRHDPSQVVVDEVAGQMVTLLFTGGTMWGLLAGFLLFRALDIAKPWPVRSLERLPGGYGIMADDLMAGLYGNVVLQAARLALPGTF